MGEKRSNSFELNRNSYFLLFLLALAIFFLFNSVNVESSDLINKIVYCSANESSCTCGEDCDNSNPFSAETDNTIDGCNDGSEVFVGSPLYDYWEFVQNVKITNMNMSVNENYDGGDFVKVDATLLCSINSDYYFIYYKNSTSNGDAWQLINSSECISDDNINYLSELKNVSTTFKLDHKNANQTVRIIISYSPYVQNYSCGFDYDSMYSDTDDMVFEVLDTNDLKAPLIDVLTPNLNSVFESSADNKTLEVIFNITDETGIDDAYVNLSYLDYMTLNITNEGKVLEEYSGLYYANISIPPFFVGKITLNFYANDTISINSGYSVPNNVNNHTSRIMYFINNKSINITTPEMLSVKNDSVQAINVTIIENDATKNNTLKMIYLNGTNIDLNTGGVILVDENTTIYSLNYSFNEGENMFRVCIANITTNDSIDCSFSVFTVDLTSPSVSSDNLMPYYDNNVPVTFLMNISDLISKISYLNISIVDSNDISLLFINNTKNEKENLIPISINITNLGNYFVLVNAVDSAGNKNNVDYFFGVVDANPPNVSVVYLPNDSISLDPNKTVFFNISVNDESVIKYTNIDVSLGNNSILSLNLTPSSYEVNGSVNLYDYIFNFTPIDIGVYNFSISSLDDNFNLRTKEIEIVEDFEISYKSSFENSTHITNIGDYALANYYLVNNTGDTPINISLLTNSILETYLSENIQMLTPGEQKKVGVFVKSGDYVNDYTINVETVCTTNGCINELSNSSSKIDSFSLYVTNDYAFLTLEDDIGGIVYDESRKEYVLLVKNIGKSNASDINIQIIPDNTLFNVSEDNFYLEKLSGLNGVNEFSFNFNITAAKTDSDINVTLTFNLSYNNSADIFYKNITKIVALKQTPVRIREISSNQKSSSSKSSGSFGGSILPVLKNVNLTEERIVNTTNIINQTNNSKPNASSNLMIDDTPHKVIDAAINDGTLIKVPDNSKQYKETNQENNMLTGYAITETEFKNLVSNKEFLRKVFSYMFLGVVLYLALLQVVLRISRR